MKSFQQNERYAYSAVGHPARRDADGCYYCRALRIRMDDEYILCPDCPLNGGETDNGDGIAPECFYYDLDLQDAFEIAPEELCRRENALIGGELVPKFPFFLTDIGAVRRFGIMEEAIQFAAEAHDGQVRKGSGKPYICHPIEVMMLVARMTPDPEVAAAAALHDTLEDTDTTEEDIRSRFGERVLNLVRSESENKRPGVPKAESWQIRKEEALQQAERGSRDEKIIMLADKLSNIRSTWREWQQIGDQVFERFNVKDKKRHEWYARSCLRVLAELQDLPQYGEFRHLVDTIYGRE